MNSIQQLDERKEARRVLFGADSDAEGVVVELREAELSQPKYSPGYGVENPVSVERSALDLSAEDVTRLISFFEQLDRWDREGPRGTISM